MSRISWVVAASLCLAAPGCDRSGETPTSSPSAEAPPMFEPALPGEPAVVPELAPPSVIAADEPTPTPDDSAALDRARKAAEQVMAEASGADVSLARSGLPDATQLAMVKLLKSVAAFTQRKGRIPFRVVHAPMWDEVMARSKADLAAPDGPGRAARVRAAATVMTAPDATPYDRAAGYSFLKVAMAARAEAGGDVAADDHIRRALLARIPTSDEDEEVRHVYDVLGVTPSPLLTAVFVAAGADGSTNAIRMWALRGLLNGVRARRAQPEPGALRAIFRYSLNDQVHSALVDVGAALRMPAVSVWCAAEGLLLRSEACRMGLAGMVTEPAFERLFPFVDAQEKDPFGQGGRYYGFRDDFALLDLYPDEPYAADRYYTVLDRALGRVDRSGFATGFIVRRMASLGDVDRALTMLKAHRPAYHARFGEPPHPRGVQFVLAEIDFAIAALEARAAGKPAPPRTDPWFSEPLPTSPLSRTARP